MCRQARTDFPVSTLTNFYKLNAHVIVSFCQVPLANFERLQNPGCILIIMSDHCNHHEGCGHDHLGNDLGPEDNLYTQIDKDNVVALNGTGPGSDIIKPWSERLDTSKFLESDADDQL